MRSAACAAAIAVAALAAPGCVGGQDVDRDAYVAENVAILDALPAFPGSTMLEEVSTVYRETEIGAVVGYVTRRDLSLPVDVSGDAVTAYYEEQFVPEWEVVERLDGPVLNLRREGASVSINAESWRAHVLEIAVDHAAFDEPG